MIRQCFFYDFQFVRLKLLRLKLFKTGSKTGFSSDFKWDFRILNGSKKPIISLCQKHQKIIIIFFSQNEYSQIG